MSLDWKRIFKNKTEAFLATENNRISKLLIDDFHLCVVRHNESLIAFEDKCPHRGRSFVGGSCINGIVECPVHKYKFNVNSNSKVRSLNFVELKISEEGVWAGIDKGFW